MFSFASHLREKSSFRHERADISRGLTYMKAIQSYFAPASPTVFGNHSVFPVCIIPPIRRLLKFQRKRHTKNYEFIYILCSRYL